MRCRHHNTLRVQLNDDVTEMVSFHKTNLFTETSSFRQFCIVRSVTHPSCRSNVAAILPPQNQSKTPTAIIRKMSIHVEFEEGDGRWTPTCVVTNNSGVRSHGLKAILTEVMLIIMAGFHGTLDCFVNRDCSSCWTSFILFGMTPKVFLPQVKEEKFEWKKELKKMS